MPKLTKQEATNRILAIIEKMPAPVKSAPQVSAIQRLAESQPMINAMKEKASGKRTNTRGLQSVSTSGSDSKTQPGLPVKYNS